MRWMFLHYVNANKVNITHLANACASELDVSPKWLRIKLSQWKAAKEVPKQEDFIQRIGTIAREMNVPVRSLLALDDDQDVARELMMYQLGLTESDLTKL
jgi:hypothetical protein